LERAEIVKHVGEANILPHVSAALERARKINEELLGLDGDVAENLRDQAI